MSVRKVGDGRSRRPRAEVLAGDESNISATKKGGDLCQRLREMLDSGPEWGAFFGRRCETSPFRLRAQCWQFGEGLRDRDLSADRPRHEDLEDALLDLARERYPDEPGGRWDPLHAAELAAKAMRYLAENFPEAEGAEELHPLMDAAHEAAVRGDHAGYRAALRGYAREGRRVALAIRASREAEALEETAEGAA